MTPLANRSVQHAEMEGWKSQLQKPEVEAEKIMRISKRADVQGFVESHVSKHLRIL